MIVQFNVFSGSLVSRYGEIRLRRAGGVVSPAQSQGQAAGEVPSLRQGGGRHPVRDGRAAGACPARRLYRDGSDAARPPGHPRSLRERGLSAREAGGQLTLLCSLLSSSLSSRRRGHTKTITRRTWIRARKSTMSER